MILGILFFLGVGIFITAVSFPLWANLFINFDKTDYEDDIEDNY